jgi:hypothetical protein
MIGYDKEQDNIEERTWYLINQFVKYPTPINHCNKKNIAIPEI